MYQTTQRKLLIFCGLTSIGLVLFSAFIYIGWSRAGDSDLPIVTRRALVYGLVGGLSAGAFYGVSLGLLQLIFHRTIGGWKSFVAYVGIHVIIWSSVVFIGAVFSGYAALTVTLGFSLTFGLIWSVYKVYKLRQKLKYLQSQATRGVY